MANPVNMETLQGYWEELQSQRGNTERESIALTNELIKQLGSLTSAYEQMSLDKERHEEYARTAQQKNRELKLKVDDITKQMDRDTSILVLIDGDGLLFDDDYIRGGESGGSDAAQMLYQAVAQHVRDRVPSIPSDVKILVRVYANLLGLGKAYSEAGICDYNTLHSFTRGFTKARAHFDFVDCGAGKERADNKIGAAFNLYVNNIQTRHIMLGCSHDNGYARLLEELSSSEYGKISLLEGVPFPWELGNFKDKYNIRTVKFDGLFRSSKLEPAGRSVFTEAMHSPQTAFLPAKISTTPIPNEEANNLQNGHDLPIRSSSASTTESGPGHPPAKTNGANSTNAPQHQTGSSNWAGKASAAATLNKSGHVQQGSSSNTSSTGASNVRRNRRGQRIDPQKPAALDQDTIQRVQNMKLCNNFYLKKECKYSNQNCSHDHYYKPEKLEMEALRYIARRIPCINRAACTDSRCTAGHRCPWMSGGTCHFQDMGTCKFPNDLHHNDTVEVKTTTVR